MKLRIVVFAIHFPPHVSGESDFAFNVARTLHASEHDVTIVVPPVNKVVPEDTVFGSSLLRILDYKAIRPLRTLGGMLGWPFSMFKFYRIMASVVKEKKPDICFYTSYMSWTALPAIIMKVPFVQMLHGEEISFTKMRSLPTRLILHLLCSRVDWILFNSEYSRQLLRLLSDSFLEKASILGSAIDTEVTWTTERRSEARANLEWPEFPAILTVARFVHTKGVDIVIRAMPYILVVYPTCRYVVVGDGDHRSECEALACELQLTDNVMFLGRISHESKEHVYAASDVFVMTSRRGTRGEEEGFGLTFLEANLQGLPVVGSRCGGIPTSVEHEGSGILVPQEDPVAVSDAVIRLLKNEDLREKMAQRGKEKIMGTFNWDALGNIIVETMQKVLNEDQKNE